MCMSKGDTHTHMHISTYPHAVQTTKKAATVHSSKLAILGRMSSSTLVTTQHACSRGRCMCFYKCASRSRMCAFVRHEAFITCMTDYTLKHCTCATLHLTSGMKWHIWHHSGWTYREVTSESALQVTPEKLHALEAGKVQSASWLLGSIAVFRLYRAAACWAARDPAGKHVLHSLLLCDEHRRGQIYCWSDNVMCMAVLLLWQRYQCACACGCNFTRQGLF